MFIFLFMYLLFLVLYDNHEDVTIFSQENRVFSFVKYVSNVH